jgi:uncharacterized SAM-binding protein YcdF (DUF218 family)
MSRRWSGRPGGQDGDPAVALSVVQTLVRTRRRRVTCGVLAVAGLLFCAASWRLFARPAGKTNHPEPADAIVMYGGSGPRFARARAMAEAGLAPVLVISDPVDPDPNQPWTAYKSFCMGDHPYESICFNPEPRTTQGESRYFAQLAQERGWSKVIIVSDTQQATRARMLLGRCWEGGTQIVTVRPSLNRLFRVGYEWAALSRAVVLRRDC